MPDRHHHHHHHHHHYQREGYAYQAGEPGPGPNRHRLRRNTQRGKIAGVSAGLADYFDWNVNWVRLGWIVTTVVFFPVPLIAYAVMAILMKPARPDEPVYASREEESFWRTFSSRPTETFSSLKHRFRALDARIGQMEQAVTSSEYDLRRQFRDLERGA
jgi:phage shock protein C